MRNMDKDKDQDKDNDKEQVTETERDGDFEFESVDGMRESIIDFLKSFNNFATKKTLGQGVLDIALLAANISKLQTVLQRERKDGVYYTLIVIISISIGLQLVVGVMMGYIGKMTLKTEQQRKFAHILNNIITILVSVICVINIALSVIDFSAPISKQPIS